MDKEEIIEIEQVFTNICKASFNLDLGIESITVSDAVFKEVFEGKLGYYHGILPTNPKEVSFPNPYQRLTIRSTEYEKYQEVIDDSRIKSFEMFLNAKRLWG